MVIPRIDRERLTDSNSGLILARDAHSSGGGADIVRFQSLQVNVLMMVRKG